MRVRTLFLTALGAVLLHAAPAPAQTIRAGMPVDSAVAVLGPPALTREAGEWLYLFYANGCAPRCGSDDVVFVQGGRVVAAVFRTPRRRFVGPAPSRALEGTVGRRMEHPEIRVLGTPVEEPDTIDPTPPGRP